MHCIITQAYLIYSSSVAAGAQSGIEECKYQFAWDRWNCPERALQLSTHSSLRSGKSWPPHPSQNNSTPSQIFPHAYEAEIPTHGKHGRFSKMFKKWYATVCFFFFFFFRFISDAWVFLSSLCLTNICLVQRVGIVTEASKTRAKTKRHSCPTESQPLHTEIHKHKETDLFGNIK